jgi:hypothetical protein
MSSEPYSIRRLVKSNHQVLEFLGTDPKDALQIRGSVYINCTKGLNVVRQSISHQNVLLRGKRIANVKGVTSGFGKIVCS